MKNKIIFIIVIGLIIFGFSYFAPKKQNQWRGIYYPNGDILDSSAAISSPIYSTFKECKVWTKTQLDSTNNVDTKAVCTLNCKNPNDFTILEDCEEIIRSWPMFPTTILLDNYQEK